jgi:phage terminase small subunit
MTDAHTVNHRQQKFIEAVASGLSTQEAARHAGFSPSYARKSSRLLKQPMIASAIAGIRMEGRKLAAYDVATAMQEALEDHKFAVEKGNAMAAVKATELRAKLSGLLIDRIEVVPVDLRGALDRAEARVLNVTNVPSNGASSPVKSLPLPAAGSGRWRPHIPGDSGDPEAGPADGQGGNAA